MLEFVKSLISEQVMVWSFFFLGHCTLIHSSVVSCLFSVLNIVSTFHYVSMFCVFFIPASLILVALDRRACSYNREFFFGLLFFTFDFEFALLLFHAFDVRLHVRINLTFPYDPSQNCHEKLVVLEGLLNVRF